MVGLDVDVPAGGAINAGYQQGLIVASAGPQTLRLVPPLIITPKEIDLAVERLGAALALAVRMAYCSSCRGPDGNDYPAGD